MTSGNFKYLDPASILNTPNNPSGKNKPYAKVDGPGTSYNLGDTKRHVTNIRGQEANFTTDTAGFAFHNSPARETSFTEDKAIREGYYAEVEDILRQKLPGIKKVVIFDHTIRRRDISSPRQPVQQVHVDQTPQAAEIRVRRHVTDTQEAELLLKGRYQIINVWRPIGHPASDFPLAVIDWRSTNPKDFTKIDLLYPKRKTNGANGTNGTHDDDDRGKEQLPDPSSMTSSDGYEVKGETYGVVPNDNHKLYYVKDMTPEETMFIKCFDSRSQNVVGSESAIGKGTQGLADCTPHTAFIDPQTPADAVGRQSIEVRCLVFYD